MTDPDIIIRSATPADRAFLDSLDERLIGEAVVSGISRDAIAAFQTRYTKEALDSALPEARTLIAEDRARQALGYIHLEPKEDPLAGATVGYVSLLAVRAEAEGRGVAKRLMAAAEEWAIDRGYPFLLLDAYASNAPARRFYARQGFTEDSLRLRRQVPG